MNYKQKLAYIALGGILIFMGLLVSHTLNRDVTAQEKVTVIVAGDPPADISVSEYLHLFFYSELVRPHILNHQQGGFQLLTPHVWFTDSLFVSKGLVYMICPYGDQSFNRLELRSAIRDVAYYAVRRFEMASQWPNVKKRWSPSDPLAHFVIRHVRFEAPNETLAVTLNGITYFDSTMFVKAMLRVQDSGGNWDALK